MKEDASLVGARIVHQPIAAEGGSGRFSVVVDGQECELDYRLAHGVMTITHTGVPAPVGGRGIAAELVKAALEAARAARWKVRPACSYAAVFTQRHPEYSELLA